MAPRRRRRRWIAIVGATAAMAVGLWSTIASGAPSNVVVAPAVTSAAPHVSWSDDGADGAVTAPYDVYRASPDCTGAFGLAGSTAGLSFDDTAVGQGTYCYRVVGHYAGGDKTVGAAPVTYDTTPPTVQITSPAAGSFVHGTVAITATASDALSNPVTVRVSVVNVTTPVAPPLAWDTVHLATSGQTYTIRADATDAAGITATTTESVTVDNTPPAAPGVSAAPVVTGSPLLTWPVVAGETYTVARTSATGPGPKTFPSSAIGTWSDPDALPPGTYTYVVTATDAALNTAASPTVTVVVISPGVTAPRSLTAPSPTSSVPHLTWQPPVTFAVTSWEVYRDGAPLQPIADPSANSFSDTTASQGPHTYAVQALSGGTAGDMSNSVAVTYDNVPPVLASASATASSNGTVAITWPAATDPDPGSGVSTYVVRRAAGASAPSDAASGTGICTLTAPATGCMDTTAKSGTFYAYAVFAVDAAGNFTKRDASAKAIDTVAPDPVTGLRVVSSDRTYVRLGWNAPALKGNDSDLAGFRVLILPPGAKAPTGPGDGTVVCRNDDPTDTICDSLNLKTGKKVTYAVYAYDGVPNYSTPMVISAVPHSIDKTPPHKPTSVALSHAGLVYTLKWVSPRDPDLSKFRVTLTAKTTAPRPSVGRAIVTGRVLHATFTLKAGQKVYVNLFALDVTGNFSRVSQYIDAPSIQTKSKHKAGKKKAAATKKTVKKKAPKLKLAGTKDKPVTVVIA